MSNQVPPKGQMTMVLRTYAVTLVVFTVMDAVWLGVIGMPMFAARLGDWLRPQPMWAAVVAFYLIYAAGLVFLAVEPSRAGIGKGAAGLRGALLGLVAYATFDLSCLAVLHRYTVALALTDMAWGTVASGVVAYVGRALHEHWQGRRGAISGARRA